MHVDLANSPIGREQLIAKGRGRRDPHHDKTNPCIPMAAIASVCQPGERFGEISAIFGLNRSAKINKRRLALVLDELCERHALEYGVELRRRRKALSNLPKFVTGERPIAHYAGVSKLEMPPLGRAHDIRKARHHIRGIRRTDVLRAMAAPACGLVQLGDGKPEEALESLQRARRALQEFDAPYLAACVRIEAALACRALGDEEGVDLELDAARIVLKQLGAVPELVRIDALAGTVVPINRTA
jgi:hypothetical protein